MNTQWGMPCEHRCRGRTLREDRVRDRNGGIHKPQDTADYQQPHKPGKTHRAETPAGNQVLAFSDFEPPELGRKKSVSSHPV